MRKVLFLFLLAISWSCAQKAVEKPDNLIDESTMVNILYDLSVIEAMKTRDPKLGHSSSEYIYKKYNVDSMQFARSNQYYAAEIDQYKKIYEKVDARLNQEKQHADSLAGKTGKPAPTGMETPQIK